MKMLIGDLISIMEKFLFAPGKSGNAHFCIVSISLLYPNSDLGYVGFALNVLL
jgi:hypothetical protein